MGQGGSLHSLVAHDSPGRFLASREGGINTTDPQCRPTFTPSSPEATDPDTPSGLLVSQATLCVSDPGSASTARFAHARSVQVTIQVTWQESFRLRDSIPRHAF